MPQLLAKLLEVDITPLFPHPLAGYTNRKNNFAAVNDKLIASLIYFNHNNTAFLIASIDSLFVHQRLKTIVMDGILKKEKLQPENFFLTATHTHFSPSLDPDKPLLQGYSQGYFDWVCEQLIRGIDSLEEMEAIPVEIKHSKTKTGLSINRRRRFISWEGFIPKKSTYNAPNFLKKFNDEIRVISLWNKNKPIGVIWNYAAHPTVYPEMDKITANYMGAIRSNLKKEYGSDITVCFLQGFAGDIRPMIPSGLNSWAKKMKNLFFIKDPFVAINREQYQQWVQQLFLHVQDCLKTAELIHPDDLEMKGKLISFQLDEIMTLENDKNPEITMQEMALSEQLKLIGISAEPLMDVQELVRKVYPTGELFCCGYINTVFGYLPTQQEVMLGGYEISEFQQLFNIKGKFKQDLDQLLVKKITLLKEYEKN
jgi:hypothetical protein